MAYEKRLSKVKYNALHPTDCHCATNAGYFTPSSLPLPTDPGSVIPDERKWYIAGER